MLGIFELDEDRKKNSLMIPIAGEQNGRDFIQISSLRDLVMAEFEFGADDQTSPRVPAPDDGRLTVSSPSQGFLSKFDPLFCNLEGHRSEFCP